MAEVVFFQALSQDGFVTDADGSVAWQGPYFIPELGFHDFIAGVSAVIMARATYDKIAAAGSKWPYGAIPGVIPSDTPLADIGAPVSAVGDDPVVIIAAARAKGDGTVWVQGDTPLAQRLIAAGLVDRLELFVMPVTLREGSEHFDRNDLPGFVLTSSADFANGVTKLVYAWG
jgi:dihydrofolate reductase